jgi:hypothetical protein
MDPETKLEELHPNVEASVIKLEEKKTRKQKRRRAIQALFDPIIQDTTSTTDLVLIGKTRRVSKYINPNEFLAMMRDAIVGKNITITENTRRYRVEELRRVMKNKGDFTLHSRLYMFKISVTIITTSSNDKLKTILNQPIDIFGVRRRALEAPLYKEDLELTRWMHRHVKIASKIHLPCITGTCYGTFEKSDVLLNIPITCDRCVVEQCVTCEADWAAHKGKTCNEFKMEKATSELTDFSTLREMFEYGTSQPCPGCLIFVSKIEGCNKMLCDRCKTKWCWACRCNLSVEYTDPYHHYDSLRVDRNGVPLNRGIRGNQMRCPAGSELTVDVRMFVAMACRRAFAKKWADYPVIRSEHFAKENKERVEKGLPLLEEKPISSSIIDDNPEEKKAVDANVDDANVDDANVDDIFRANAGIEYADMTYADYIALQLRPLEAVQQPRHRPVPPVRRRLDFAEVDVGEVVEVDDEVAARVQPVRRPQAAPIIVPYVNIDDDEALARRLQLEDDEALARRLLEDDV